MTTAHIPKQIVIDAAEKRIQNLTSRISDEGDRIEARRIRMLDELRKPSFPRFWTIPFKKADRRWGQSVNDVSRLKELWIIKDRLQAIRDLAEASNGLVTLTPEDVRFLRIGHQMTDWEEDQDISNKITLQILASYPFTRRTPGR